jgi:hypothetical protein
VWRVVLVCLLGLACSARRGSFSVLRDDAQYLLQSPRSVSTPLGSSLRDYGFANEDGSVNLRPGVQLRVENAYYEKGLPRRGLTGFLGTETVRYELRRNGLRQIDFRSALAARPDDQPTAAALIAPAQMRLPFHRLFFAVPFRRAGQASGAVLLSARRAADLDRLAARLRADPDLACADNAACTIFPEACTAAPEIEVFANGAPRAVIWGNTIQNVFFPGTPPANLAIHRLFENKLVPVVFDASDPLTLRTPLFPGDRLTWPVP